MSEEKGSLRVGYGMTINLGHYESERIDISITIPMEEEDWESFESIYEHWYKKLRMKVLQKGGKL